MVTSTVVRGGCVFAIMIDVVLIIAEVVYALIVVAIILTHIPSHVSVTCLLPMDFPCTFASTNALN